MNRTLFQKILPVVLCLCFMPLMAQKGVLKGVVRDAYTNEPLPFVNVVVVNTPNGMVADSLGRFEFANLSAGFVQVQASLLGYLPKVSEQILVYQTKPNYIQLALEQSDQSLAEVTVQGALFKTQPESPLSVRNIGIELIEKSAGANRDISKVVQSLPGVGGTVSFRNDLIVRGGGPSENRFFLDGIEIPNLNHFSTQGASGGPVGILNVDFIREVYFYSSAFPSGRGNALSSVFDIKQIDGNTDKPSFKATVGASELSLSANTPVGEKTTLLVSARRSYLQFLFKALDLPFLPTFNDFQFRSETRLNSKNELILLGIGAIDQFELNKGVSRTEESEYILSYLPVNKQWSYTLGGAYKHYFRNSFLTVVASRNHLNNLAYKFTDNVARPENQMYDYVSDEVENKFRIEYAARPAGWNITTGAGVDLSDYYNRTYNKAFDQNGFYERRYQSDLATTHWYAFGNAGKTFGAGALTVSVGFRMDASDYDSEMNNLLNQLSPRVAVSARVAGDLYANVHAGRYFQRPAYTTLGYRNADGVLVNRQNGLKYMYADHFVAGLEYRLNGHTRITAEGFYKKYNQYPFSVADSVSLASKGGDFGVFGDEEVFSNSRGRTYGFEFYATQRAPGGHSFILSYTFVRSEFANYQGVYLPSAWDSRHLLTLTAGKSFGKGWDLGLKWRFVGGLPYSPYDLDRSEIVEAWNARGREYIDFSRFNALRSDAFHQMDVRIDKAYVFSKWQLGIYLDIQNLYNFRLTEAPKLTRVLDGNEIPIVVPGVGGEPDRYVLKELVTQSGTVLPTIGVMVSF